jgi:hypothetical protein
MEQEDNFTPRWFEPEQWDGQDSSIPEEPWVPDAIDRLLHPELCDYEPSPAHPEEPLSEAEACPEQGRREASRRTAHPEKPPGEEQGALGKTHPDHGPMHLIPRQEDGRISAYYYCSKQELDSMGIDRPPPRRYRRDGFTAERQEQFLELVRGGASGREAARRIGISPTTAYNLYNSREGGAFRAAWDEAAKVTDIVLDDTAFDRAVNGQEEVVYHQGRRVGVRWKYDNNLLMKLLRARNPLKYAPLSEIEGWLKHRGVALPPDLDSALERLRSAEAEWGARLPGETPKLDMGKPVRAEPVEARAGRIAPGNPETCRGHVSPARPERLPQAGSRRALPCSQDGEGAPAEEAPVPSTSSTSPENEPREDPAHASTSSTSSGIGQGPDAPPDQAAAPEPGPPDPSVTIYRPPPRARIILDPGPT